MSHDPRAADVLMASIDRTTDEGCGCCPNTAEAYTTHALDALAAAGLVVRPADEYERATQDGEALWITRDGMTTTIPAHSTDRPLYVRKETNDGQ